MLFIFAKLNPGLTYVQGMNELVAPLYYLFATDKDGASAAAAEPDSFYCFVDLISEFRDNFCSQLDNSSVGIRATISALNELLKHRDRQLWYHLDVKNKVTGKPQAKPCRCNVMQARSRCCNSGAACCQTVKGECKLGARC